VLLKRHIHFLTNADLSRLLLVCGGEFQAGPLS
jgi:hypothetical protein